MKTISLSDLDPAIREELRGIRGGDSVTILDEGKPVARIVPLLARKPEEESFAQRADRSFKLGSIPLPPPLNLSVDPVAILIEDREKDPGRG
jgi:antitoxin (DNA-binding transcriptional repressor) of toxin-antitoxin stability system